MEASSLRAHIVLVEDSAPTLLVLAGILRSAGHEVETFADPLEALARCERGMPDLVLTDLHLPSISGNDLIQRVHAIDPSVPVIILSGTDEVMLAVQSMKFGAFDFLPKPVEPDHLREVIRRAVRFIRLQQDNQVLRREIADRDIDDEFSSSSSVLRQVYAQANIAATTATTVLITGESGTGKEVLADYIQRHSPRADKPYIKVNCGAMNQNLLESHLFGHERGAFTGAAGRHIGLFEQAQGGTIFLDEIGELAPASQTYLLRVIQERKLQRLGSTSSVDLDIRVLCATHRDLQDKVADGSFREDLFYRLNVFPLHLPPLRDRKEDLPLLCMTLLKRIRLRLGRGPTNFSPKALAILAGHDWPGNVRELENFLERASILCADETIDVSALPKLAPGLSKSREPAASRSANDAKPDGDERQRLLAVLERHHWRIKPVADELGIGRSTLYERLSRLGIRR